MLGPGGRWRSSRGGTRAARRARRRLRRAATSCCSSPEVLPRGGAGLGRVRLIRDDDLESGPAGGEVVEDRGEVGVAEATRHRGEPEGVVDGVGADEGGELD